MDAYNPENNLSKWTLVHLTLLKYIQCFLSSKVTEVEDVDK